MTASRIAGLALRVSCAVAMYACAVSSWRCEAISTTANDSPFFPEQVASSFLSTLLSPLERGAPLAELDTAWIWQRYHSHLLSATRSTSFIVLFTSDQRDCELFERDDEEDAASDPDQDGATAAAEALREQRRQACREQRAHTELVVNATRAALTQQRTTASSRPMAVVHIPQALLPQAFAVHRISSSPSLLWLPPRASKLFQRFPHAQTNALDLSLASASATATATASDRDTATVTSAIATFLRRCEMQSSSASSSSPTAAALATTSSSSSLETAINLLPFVVIALYLVLLAVQHRVALLSVLRSRVTWLVVTLGIMYVSLSGLFHSIIHKTPPFLAHPHYGLYLVHPNGRKQFFLEGLLNGSWSFVISFALFSIVDVLPKVRSEFARDEIFRLALLAIGGAYVLLHLIFMSKHRWLA